MAKHKYTFYVTKVIYMNCKVVCTEAEGQLEAENLAVAKAEEIKDWDIDKADYLVEYHSMSVKPVEG